MTDRDDPLAIARIENVPRARALGLRTGLWWLTGLCVLVAVGITFTSLGGAGTKITVHFHEGFGIKPGDALRYRGIDVGTVTDVHLVPDLQGIDVHIQLGAEHGAIAVEGSRFWIERPRLRVGQVAGLETVLGAKYVGTIPGAIGSPPQHQFTGLDNPLGLAEQDSTDVRVRFPAGDGLMPGDPVRYLGIDVGEVTHVELNDDLTSVWVGVRLIGAARQLARVGTNFWVERPRMEVSQIRGLDTLVAGRYLALEPAGQSQLAAHEFEGMTEPPPLLRRPGSLEVELESRSRMGLVRGAPVSFRGLEVGHVAQVGLASDSASVSVRVIIEPEYVELVRTNTVWWSSGGIRWDAGLTGFNVSVDSFSAWLRGGISLATPDPPGDKVVTGYRFGLAEQAEADWLKWQPHITTGPWASRDGSQVALPQLTRIAATWSSQFLGFTRRQSAESWCLPLEDGRAWLPASFVRAAQAARTPVTLEAAGSSASWDPTAIREASGVATIDLSAIEPDQRWPASKIAQKPWNGKSSLLLAHPELREPLPLDAARAEGMSDGTIMINVEVPLRKSLEGAAVVDTLDGQLLGILVWVNQRWLIVQGPR